MTTSKKLILASLSVLALPAIAMASDTAATMQYQYTFLSDSMEHVMEFANLVMALLAGIFAVKLAALSQGGSMEKTWNNLAIVAVLFVGVEVLNSLSGFGVLDVTGLSEIVEFVFAVMFAYTLYATRKDLMKKVFG